MIPYAWNLIELRLVANPIFKDLKDLINVYILKQKIR